MCDDSIAHARAHLASLLLPAAREQQTHVSYEEEDTCVSMRRRIHTASEERTTAAYALDQALVSNIIIIII